MSSVGLFTRKRPLLALGAGLLLACGSPPAPPQRGKLKEGVVATAGSAEVRVETVERIAAAMQLSRRDALERALTDAVFAEEARAQRPAATPAMLERAALARALLEGLEREAQGMGPPTDAEVEEITRARWVELDRPAAVRVSHAVALSKTPADAPAARRKAEELARALAGIRDSQAFIKAARALPADGVQVRSERLPYIAADGRGFVLEGEPAPASQFDPRFAAAANAIANAGEQSGIVESDFGYHIILLEERVPARRLSLADRRAGLRAEIVSRRAEARKRELLKRLAAATPVEIQRDFEALTGKLPR